MRPFSTFKGLLSKDTDLHRVHLELARAYFLKGEDSLAKEHFEKVYVDSPPKEVAEKIDFFLDKIKKRRPWYVTVSFGPVYDNNMNRVSGEDVIYIFDLPFRLIGGNEAESGTGMSFKASGEYRHKIMKKLHWRIGGRGELMERDGGDYDEAIVSVYTGPRWRFHPKSEVSVLAVFRESDIGEDLVMKRRKLALNRPIDGILSRDWFCAPKFQRTTGNTTEYPAERRAL